MEVITATALQHKRIAVIEQQDTTICSVLYQVLKQKAAARFACDQQLIPTDIPQFYSANQQQENYSLLRLNARNEHLVDYIQALQPDVLLIDSIDLKAYKKNAREYLQRYSRIFAALSANQQLIINTDLPIYEQLAFAIVSAGVNSLITYGSNPFAQVSLQEFTNKNDKSYIRMQVFGQSFEGEIPICDKQSYLHKMAVMAAGSAIGVDWSDAAQQIKSKTDAIPSDRVNKVMPLQAVNTVGFLVELNMEKSPNKTFSGSLLYRAKLLNKYLSTENKQVLFYSPKDVDVDSHLVEGYRIIDEKFVRCQAAIPVVNGNWTSYSRSLINEGMGYKNFKSWAYNNGVNIAVPYEFSELVSDKYVTFTTVAEFDKKLHPYTELYEHSKHQLKKFFDISDIIFLKPRRGNRGNHIIVIKKRGAKFDLNHYHDNTKTSKQMKTIHRIHRFLAEVVNDKSYIIQQGIDVKRIDDTAFDLRIIMLFDGKQWNYVHHGRLGAVNSDLSNVGQGGEELLTSEMLERVYSKNKANKLLSRSIKVSKRLAQFLNCFYRGGLVEIAFDFLFDKKGNIYVAELNSKPGVAGPEMYQDILHISDKEKFYFDIYIKPHVESLTRYFLHDIDNQKQRIWIDKLVANPIDKTEHKLLLNGIVNQLRHVANFKDNLSKSLLSDNSARMVFISVSDSTHTAYVSYACANGLVTAVESALNKLPCSYIGDFKSTWVKLDIVNEVDEINQWAVTDKIAIDRCVQGIAFAAPCEIAFLSEECLAHTLINADNELCKNNIRKYLRKYGSKKEMFNAAVDDDCERLYTFTTQGMFWCANSVCDFFGGKCRSTTVNSGVLTNSIKMACDYLQRATLKNGQFDYSYLPKRDISNTSYNILRHAGTIYAMLECYEFNPDKKLLRQIEKALFYLKNTIKPYNKFAEKTQCVVEKNAVKLGGNALAVLALCKYITVTGKTNNLPLAQQLALWIKHAQDQSGRFIIHKIAYDANDADGFISEYYPGEAIFSLTRLYQLDHNEQWLDVAEAASEYLINGRDGNLAIDELIHDHWLLYGLNELYRLRSNELYLNQAMRISTAIMNKQHINPKHADWFGGFYHPPRSTPTSVRMEGLCAAYALARDFAQDEYTKPMLTAIQACARFQLNTQFHQEKAMYLKNPHKALGGFHCSLDNFEIRIDYVQHNISALLAYYRILTSKDEKNA